MKKQLLLFLSLLTITISHSQTFDDGVLEYNVTDAVNNYVSVNNLANTCPTGNLVIPGSIIDGGTNYTITSIADDAFFECNALVSVTIPNSVISIGNAAFTYCSAMTSVNIPNSITTIGEWAFTNCTSLTNVSIPNSVTSIGRYAFSGCTNLTSVNIPDNLTSIEDSVFENCLSLTSISIPNTITSIGSNAFFNCTALTSVTVNWNVPLAIDSNVFQNVGIAGIPLNIPSGTQNAYENAPVWKDFGSYVLGTPDSVLAAQLRIYPNPTSSFLNIELDVSSELKKITIYNSLGQLVLEDTTSKISVSNYSKGLYFAQIETSKGQITKKFMVN